MVIDFWPNEPLRTTDIQVDERALAARTWRDGRLRRVVLPWEAVSNMTAASDGVNLEWPFLADTERYWDHEYEGLVGEVQKTLRNQQQVLPGFRPVVLDGGRCPWEETAPPPVGRLHLAGAATH